MTYRALPSLYNTNAAAIELRSTFLVSGVGICYSDPDVGTCYRQQTFFSSLRPPMLTQCLFSLFISQVVRALALHLRPVFATLLQAPLFGIPCFLL